jgi:acetyltransferase
VTFARVPIVHSRARRIASDLRSQALLDGVRGGPAVDRALLSDLLERVSAFLVAHPQIVELDLNPVIASGDRLLVADAAVVHAAAGA